jgi:hypothetical protein
MISSAQEIFAALFFLFFTLKTHDVRSRKIVLRCVWNKNRFVCNRRLLFLVKRTNEKEEENVWKEKFFFGGEGGNENTEELR